MKRLLILGLIAWGSVLYSVNSSVTVRTLLYCERSERVQDNPNWFVDFERALAYSNHPLRTEDYSSETNKEVQDDHVTAALKKKHTQPIFVGSFTTDKDELCRIYDLVSRRP